MRDCDKKRYAKMIIAKVEGLVQIPKIRYDQMIENEIILDCLQEYGVDNWEGYSDAMVEAGRRINDKS